MEGGKQKILCWRCLRLFSGHYLDRLQKQQYFQLQRTNGAIQETTLFTRFFLEN